LEFENAARLRDRVAVKRTGRATRQWAHPAERHKAPEGLLEAAVQDAIPAPRESGRRRTPPLLLAKPRMVG
jgi:hypothetical protein